MRCHSLSGKHFGSFLKKQKQTKHVMTCDPAITLLNIYPKEMKTYSHTKTFT